PSPLHLFLFSCSSLSVIYTLSLHDALPISNAGAHQLLYAMLSLGLCGVLVWLLTNYRVLFRYTYIFGLTGVVLLILPFVPFLNGDRKSTRLNSSHVSISYAVFCLKKKIIYK